MRSTGRQIGRTVVAAVLVAAATAAAAMAPAAVAATPAAKPVDAVPGVGAAMIDALAACLAIPDDARRLACSDTAGRALVDAARAGSVVAVDREEIKRTRSALFGFSLAPSTVLDRITNGDGKPGDAPVKLEAVIATARRDAYDKWTITLADGATWQTTEDIIGAGPRAGQKVTITRGALGGFQLQPAGGRMVRARRVG